MAIRLQDGKVITKDGKVSCDCCGGGGCFGGKNTKVTVTGIQGRAYGHITPWEGCYDIGLLCSGEYIGPDTIKGSGVGGVYGYLTAEGGLVPFYNDAPNTTINAYGCLPYDTEEPICWASFSDTPTFFQLLCDPYKWGFWLGAFRAGYIFAGIMITFEGRPINGHTYAIHAFGNTITMPNGTITVSW